MYFRLLEGSMRSAYVLKDSLTKALAEEDDDKENVVPETEKTCICSKCHPGLEALREQFENITHSYSTELQRKRSGSGTKYKCRNILKENEFLRNNVFDACGNYVFCFQCILSCFKVGSQRLTRQHKLKQDLIHETLLEVQKSNLKPRQIQHVLTPDNSAPEKYLKSLSDTDIVLVLNVVTHGLQGRVSNSAKATTKEHFKTFVKNHSTPSGRPTGTPGAKFYYLSNFTHLYPTNKIKDYENLSSICLLSAFNRAQEELERPTISAGTMCTWLKELFRDHKLFPHKSDYCDLCAQQAIQKQSIERSISQAKMNNPTILNSLEKKLDNLKADITDHRKHATDCHNYYNSQCKISKENYDKITLQATLPRRRDKLCERFEAVVSADYQQLKQIPHFGVSPQPACTYYMRKLNVDIFVIVSHFLDDKVTIIIFDETFGPKTSNHTLSFLKDLICNYEEWITRCQIWLDNAAVNKNQFLTAWAAECVQFTRYTHIRCSFQLPGHTKFKPDVVMAPMAKSYYSSDVFTVAEFADLCRKFGEVHLVASQSPEFPIMRWKDTLPHKYSALPGIQKFHDFSAKLNATGHLMCEVKPSCCRGQWQK